MVYLLCVPVAAVREGGRVVFTARGGKPTSEHVPTIITAIAFFQKITTLALCVRVCVCVCVCVTVCDCVCV